MSQGEELIFGPEGNLAEGNFLETFLPTSMLADANNACEMPMDAENGEQRQEWS